MLEDDYEDRRSVLRVMPLYYDFDWRSLKFTHKVFQANYSTNPAGDITFTYKNPVVNNNAKTLSKNLTMYAANGLTDEQFACLVTQVYVAYHDGHITIGSRSLPLS